MTYDPDSQPGGYDSPFEPGDSPLERLEASGIAEQLEELSQLDYAARRRVLARMSDAQLCDLAAAPWHADPLHEQIGDDPRK